MPTTEERLAALEKQMAAWMDQQPTTYYTHKYSGEEIDDAVDKIRSGAGEGAVRYDQAQTLTPAQQSQAQANIGTTWPCNPNLLDNWYFRRPVNQRGQTEYTGNVYGVDRWKLYQPTVSVTVREDGLGIRRTSGDFYTIVQYVDNSQDLAGKTVTFSCLILAAPGAYKLRILAGRGTTTVIASISSSAGETGIKSVTATLPDDVSDLWVSIYTGTTAEEYVVAYAKLELGPTQTLAHREGDRWVLNEVPEYGEQLRRCQRYCYRLNSHAYGWTYNNNTVNCLIPLPVTLRTTPVITLRGNGTINTTTGDASVTSYEVKNITSNGLIIDLHNTANAFTTGTPVVWHNFDVIISADL